MFTKTGKSPLGVESRQQASKKTGQKVKKSGNALAAEQLSTLPVEKSSNQHYAADQFTSEHITGLITENAALKNKV